MPTETPPKSPFQKPVILTLSEAKGQDPCISPSLLSVLARVPHPFVASSRMGWGPRRTSLSGGVVRGLSFAAANDRSCRSKLLVLLALPAALLFAHSIPQAAATSASPVHGAALFATNGCAHCHGPAGSGGDRGPDLKKVRRRMTSDQIATQIHDGGQSMPPFGDALTPQDITDLVAYLRATHKPPPPPPAPEPPPPAGPPSE